MNLFKTLRGYNLEPLLEKSLCFKFTEGCNYNVKDPSFKHNYFIESILETFTFAIK